MNEKDNIPETALTLSKGAILPVRYDTLMLHYAVTAPSSGTQTVKLASMNYILGKFGSGESGTDAGFNVKADAQFTSRTSKGVMDSSSDYRIWAIGLQFAGWPFIETADAVGDGAIAGTYMDGVQHSEALANLAIQQLTVKVTKGVDGDDSCTALGGPWMLFGDGGYGLGDNSAGARMMNALQDNRSSPRLYRSLLTTTSSEANVNPVFNFVRTSKLDLTYQTAAVLNPNSSGVGQAGTAYYEVKVFYYGRPTADDPQV